MVWPVGVSFAVEGHRTSKRLMTGPLFIFRGEVLAKNFIFLCEWINDSRLVDIVRRHFEFQTIASCEPDKTFPHFFAEIWASTTRCLFASATHNITRGSTDAIIPSASTAFLKLMIFENNCQLQSRSRESGFKSPLRRPQLTIYHATNRTEVIQ
jgi:hypothetical protein